MTIFHLIIGSFVVLNAVYSLQIDDNAINYLRNFGYLSKQSTSSRFGDDILHEDILINSLKMLQKFGNINQTGVLDEATKELLKKPRCGNPDFELTQPTVGRRQKRYTLGPSKWGKLEITWKFMNKRHPRNRDEFNRILRLIDEAMRIWEHNSLLKLRRSNDDASDILIDFAQGDHGDNYNFNGRGNNLAHAFYPGSGLGGDVHLDEDELWDFDNLKAGSDGAVSFFYTLLHELGHSLGLAHSSTTESIMYPWYSASRTFDRSTMDLYEDDQLAIQELYGKTERSKWGPATRYKTTRPTIRTTPSTTTQRTRPTESQRNYPSISTSTKGPKPDTCNTDYDAIAIVRGELMIFKGRYMWRISSDGEVMQGFPTETIRMWSNLPDDFTHIDAVFERKDGKIIFFIGEEVFVFNANRIEYTHDLKYLGFGHTVKKIDAIFKWGHNNKTFIFSGDEYWKVDDNLKVEPTYPRTIYKVWKKVNQLNFDTAFQNGGKTYFFKGNVFYEFDDLRMKLNLRKPFLSSQRWMNCMPKEEDLETIQALARVQESKEQLETSSAPTTSTTFSVFTTLLAILSFSFI